METNIDIIRDFIVGAYATGRNVVSMDRALCALNEFEVECERLRKAYIENEFAVKTSLLKAMGITVFPGSISAEELVEMLANHTDYRVQKYSTCPKCNGTKIYSYKDHVYDGECICTIPCDECGRTGFVWQTVEVK